VSVTDPAMFSGDGALLQAIWDAGYSIAELWGHAGAVTRATTAIDGDHPLLWGVLGIADYQVDRGAGQKYLRDRLFAGDWVAVGYRAPKTEGAPLVLVPRIADAKFGKKQSAIGKDDTDYVDLRIVHARYLDRI
jgi:hypothetical protein